MTTQAPRHTTAELVKVAGVSRSYGRASEAFTALRDIDLSLNEGEFVALLGPSGCGKITLLRLITGLIGPPVARCSTAASRCAESTPRPPSCSRPSPCSPG